jgi:hypothetical protein
MKLFLRFVLVAISVWSLLCIASLLIGHSLPTRTGINYLTNQVESYVLSAEDSNRSLLLTLGGTRCFDPFPHAYYAALLEAGDTSDWTSPGWLRVQEKIDVLSLLLLLDCQ